MENELSDIYLVQSTGDSQAMENLIAAHSGVYLDVLNRYLPESIFPIEKEDYKASKDFFIYKAVLSYKPEKQMKFSTYLGQTIKWESLNLRHKKRLDVVSMEELSSPLEDKAVCDDESKEKIEQVFRFADTYPNDLAKSIFYMRYDKQYKKPWKQIASQFNISTQWARILCDKLLKDARECLVYKGDDEQFGP